MGHLNTIQPEHRGIPKQAKVIAVSSGKGGVGKSSISLSLAVELSAHNNKVCVFDADTNLANINIMTGLNPLHTLHDYLVKKLSIDDILIEGPAGISIIPSASGMVDLVNFDQKKQKSLLGLIQQLESQFDYILVDTSAGITESVLGFVKGAAQTIIIITPEPTSLTDAFSLLKVLKQSGFDRSFQVLVNRVKNFKEAKEVIFRFAKAVNKYLDLKVVSPGYIYEDRNVPRSIMAQKPFSVIYPRSSASHCLRNIARKIEQGEVSRVKAFSEYLSEEVSLKVETDNPLELQSDLDKVLASLHDYPVNEVEQFLSMASQQWLKKIEAESFEEQYFESDGYKAAIKFASKLKP